MLPDVYFAQTLLFIGYKYIISCISAISMEKMIKFNCVSIPIRVGKSYYLNKHLKILSSLKIEPSSIFKVDELF